MYLLLDIGGTHTRIGLASSLDGLDTDTVSIIPTPESIDAFETKLRDIVEIQPPNQIRGVSIAVAGRFDTDAELVAAPHLPQFVGYSFKKFFTRTCGISQTLSFNDALVAGYGELMLLDDRQSLTVYITVSTGVGGGVYLNGTIHREFIDFEPGHMILDHDSHATVEHLLSGSGLQARHGIPANEISDSAIWKQWQDDMVMFLHSLLRVVPAKHIVLGGSVITKNVFTDLPSLIAALETQLVKSNMQQPRISVSQLDDLAALSGGLALLLEGNS